MKWYSTLTTLSLALLVSANPVPQKSNRPQVYRLKVVAKHRELTGAYLTVDNGGAGGVSWVGVIPSGSPVQVYTVESPNKGQVELHTYPIGIVDHVLGLVGAGGVLNLSDITNPSSTEFTPGTTVDWTSFKFGGDGDKGNSVTYAGKAGGWIAVPAGYEAWTVKWYDGKALIPQDYMRIEIVYDPVKTVN